MQLNFIIRTNYFKVSRTVRHNVIAKETVSAAKGAADRPKREQEGESEATRGGTWSTENIIPLGIRLSPLLPFIKVITRTDLRHKYLGASASLIGTVGKYSAVDSQGIFCKVCWHSQVADDVFRLTLQLRASSTYVTPRT